MQQHASCPEQRDAVLQCSTQVSLSCSVHGTVPIVMNWPCCKVHALERLLTGC